MTPEVGSIVRAQDGTEGEVLAVAEGLAAVRPSRSRTLTVFFPVTDLVVLDGEAARREQEPAQ